MGNLPLFLQPLGWALFDSLWQMAFLWIVFQAVTGIFQKLKPAAKNNLAFLLLTTGFLWFIYTFITAYSNPETGNPATFLFFAEGNFGIYNLLQQLVPVVSVFYLVLLLFSFMRLMKNYRYVQVIRKYGLAKADVEWKLFINKVAKHIGIKKPVHIWLSEFISSPVTIGYLKPVILFPLAAINQLTPQQMEAVLLHELSHIRRSDYLINLIMNVIHTILYFNPFVKAFVKIAEKEREKSCDEMVLQFQYNAYDYATALVLLEKNKQLQKSLLLAAVGQGKPLLHRVELIMGIHKKTVFSFSKIAGSVAGLACVFLLNSLFIAKKSESNKQAILAVNPPVQSGFIAAAEKEAPTTLLLEKPEKTTAYSRQKQARRKTIQPAERQAPEGLVIAAGDNTGGAIHANFTFLQQPELKKYQEEQIKEAIAGSRKVLENEQWKAIEKNMADVFDQKEKAELKMVYEKELDKVDWTNWESKLRLAYTQMDWEKINYRLSNALNQIHLDSLQRVCNDRAVDLGIMEKKMLSGSVNLVTGETIKEIQQRRKQFLNLSEKIEVAKSKNIAHL